MCVSKFGTPPVRVPNFETSRGYHHQGVMRLPPLLQNMNRLSAVVCGTTNELCSEDTEGTRLVLVGEIIAVVPKTFVGANSPAVRNVDTECGAVGNSTAEPKCG